MRIIYRQALILMLFSLGTGNLALAQNWGTASTARQFQKKPTAQEIAERKKRQRQQYKSTRLPARVTIPFLPDYPAQKNGIKLVRAIKYSSLGQGNNCIVQTFSLKDQTDAVRNWYQGTLTSNGWAVSAANRTGTQILGRKVKQGASVHIMISPIKEKSSAFRTQVQVRYIQFQPLPDD